MKYIEIKHRSTGEVLHIVQADTLRGANLIGLNLRGADLYGADLSGANLSYANLSYANLRGANLSYADLIGANLIGLNLRGANLSGANLSGANLYGASLYGAKRHTHTIETFTTINKIGSRNDTLLALKTDGGVFIETGCFKGTLTAFAAAVEERHGDTKHGKAYRAALALIDVLFA
jgi:hypothetical protein